MQTKSSFTLKLLPNIFNEKNNLSSAWAGTYKYPTLATCIEPKLIFIANIMKSSCVNWFLTGRNYQASTCQLADTEKC